MQVCLQCQFIYEDDQERCDMDGSELVYEPTLEHAFPTAGRLPERTKLIIPIKSGVLTRLDQVPTVATTRPRRIAWQIAAAIVAAGVAFLAFYAARSLVGSRPRAPLRVSTENFASVSAAVAAVAPNDPVIENDPVDLPSPNKPKTLAAVREAPVAALPGLPPLPRLKPLPGLKPIPRLADQSRAMNANHKSVLLTAKPKSANKESRLGSFLKKTGRALKKPFK